MNDSITVQVTELKEYILPWYEWRIGWYTRLVVEPHWMFYLRLMLLIWRARIHTIPLAIWYDKDTDSINIERVRRQWWIRWYCWDNVAYEEVQREIEIHFRYWWNESEPEVGYREEWLEWETTKATYCDTGKPYKGDLDVWNDDIGQHITDNG